MSFLISPVLQGQIFSNLGKPLSGGKVYAYQAGSFSTLQNTFTSSDGDTENENPLTLDAAGRVPPMFLSSDLEYNLVLTAPDGTTVIQYFDGVAGGITGLDLEAAIDGLDFLPLTGGVLTGALTVNGSTQLQGVFVGGALAVSGGSSLQAVTATTVTATLNANSQRVQNVGTPTAAADAATKAYVDTAAGSSGLPAGTVLYTAASSTPTGFLIADGGSLVRADYPALFAAIGTTYGSASGTTFNLPDLRGTFIRGLDAGRGLDTGRALGSYQADEFASHTHTINADNGGFNVGIVNVSGTDRTTTSYTPPTNATGGSETRPKNVALVAIIKT